ncbi:MAG: Hsp20/alpha crystallin family protein [Thermoprotei archaeon]
MPVFRDLDEMIRSMMRRMEEEMRQMEREIEQEFRNALANYERPLYSIIDHGGYYEVVIDLPFSDPKTLKVSVVNNVLILSAEGRHNRNYFVKLTLPEDADAKTANVERVKNFVRIKINKIST